MAGKKPSLTTKKKGTKPGRNQATLLQAWGYYGTDGRPLAEPPPLSTESVHPSVTKEQSALVRQPTEANPYIPRPSPKPATPLISNGFRKNNSWRFKGGNKRFLNRTNQMTTSGVGVKVKQQTPKDEDIIVLSDSEDNTVPSTSNAFAGVTLSSNVKKNDQPLFPKKGKIPKQALKKGMAMYSDNIYLQPFEETIHRRRFALRQTETPPLTIPSPTKQLLTLNDVVSNETVPPAFSVLNRFDLSAHAQTQRSMLGRTEYKGLDVYIGHSSRTEAFVKLTQLCARFGTFGPDDQAGFVQQLDMRDVYQPNEAEYETKQNGLATSLSVTASASVTKKTAAKPLTTRKKRAPGRRKKATATAEKESMDVEFVAEVRAPLSEAHFIDIRPPNVKSAEDKLDHLLTRLELEMQRSLLGNDHITSDTGNVCEINQSTVLNRPTDQRESHDRYNSADDDFQWMNAVSIAHKPTQTGASQSQTSASQIKTANHRMSNLKNNIDRKPERELQNAPGLSNSNFDWLMGMAGKVPSRARMTDSQSANPECSLDQSGGAPKTTNISLTLSEAMDYIQTSTPNAKSVVNPSSKETVTSQPLANVSSVLPNNISWMDMDLGFDFFAPSPPELNPVHAEGRDMRQQLGGNLSANPSLCENNVAVPTCAKSFVPARALAETPEKVEQNLTGAIGKTPNSSNQSNHSVNDGLGFDFFADSPRSLLPTQPPVVISDTGTSHVESCESSADVIPPSPVVPQRKAVRSQRISIPKRKLLPLSEAVINRQQLTPPKINRISSRDLPETFEQSPVFGD